MNNEIELTDETSVDLNVLLTGLVVLAEDMAQAEDPFAKRLDDMLIRFYRKVTGTPLERE